LRIPIIITGIMISMVFIRNHYAITAIRGRHSHLYNILRGGYYTHERNVCRFRIVMPQCLLNYRIRDVSL